MARSGQYALPWLAALTLFAVPEAALADTVLGYQLGITQSVGGTYGDNAQALVAAPGGAQVQQLQGVQFNTSATGNVTVDWIGSRLSQGLVLGTAFTQILPTAVPEEAPAVLAQRTTTFTANATYLGRLVQPRWSLAFGGGYIFGLNGRLQSSADGTAGGQAGVLPAANAGAFAFSGRTHNASGRLGLVLNRARWDLSLNGTYTYSKNGIFNLAAGALGGLPTPGLGTNLGAFVSANVHSLNPSLNYRARIGRRGLTSWTLGTNVTLVEDIDDELEVRGTQTFVVPAPPGLPDTIINTLRGEYAYEASQERALGADALVTFGMRVPTDVRGNAFVGYGMSPDTLVTNLRAFYRDNFLRARLRLRASVGAAQASLFQAPFGLGGSPDEFDSIRSRWIPVGELGLTRRFEPIDVNFAFTRNVGQGALGASAVVTEGASLIFNYVAELGQRRLLTNVGFNVNRTRGVGRDLFAIPANATALAAAFNNQGFGANLGLGMPLWTNAQFAVDGALSYNFNYVELGEAAPGVLPELATHVALLTLRGLFGRGTAQRAVNAAGRTDADELDAFSADPRSGSPLTTARLLQQGAPLLDPTPRPGAEAAPRADTRQSFRESLAAQQLEQQARARAGAVEGLGSARDEERRALAREEAEQAQKREVRTRDFGAWPIDAEKEGDSKAEETPEEAPEEGPPSANPKESPE